MKIVQVLHGMTQFGNLIADGVKQSSRSVIVFTDYSHIGKITCFVFITQYFGVSVTLWELIQYTVLIM